MPLPEDLPPWLTIVLFLLFGSPALFTKAASRLPSVLGAPARWWQGRQPEVRQEVRASAAYARQQKEIERLGEQYDRLELDWREQSDRLDRLEVKLAETEDRLTQTNRRFFSALGYIRELVVTIGRIDPEHRVPDAPDMLREYL